MMKIQYDCQVLSNFYADYGRKISDEIIADNFQRRSVGCDSQVCYVRGSIPRVQGIVTVFTLI